MTPPKPASRAPGPHQSRTRQWMSGRVARRGLGGWALRPLPARATTTRRPRIGNASVRSRRWSEDPFPRLPSRHPPATRVIPFADKVGPACYFCSTTTAEPRSASAALVAVSRRPFRGWFRATACPSPRWSRLARSRGRRPTPRRSGPSRRWSGRRPAPRARGRPHRTGRE